VAARGSTLGAPSSIARLLGQAPAAEVALCSQMKFSWRTGRGLAEANSHSACTASNHKHSYVHSPCAGVVVGSVGTTELH